MPFDDLSGIEIRATRLDLVVEADAELNGAVRLLAEPGTGAPELTMHGSRLVISQEGRYRGMSPPVLKLPVNELPTIAANVSRGNLTIENIAASLAINIDSGNLRISGGDGDAAVNVSSGDAAIRQREGSIACRVSSGNLIVAGCRGSLALEVSKGNVDVQDCRGDLNLRLDKGDVSIIRPIEQHLRISGSKSDIRIQGGSLSTADVNITRGDIASTARLLFTEPVEPEDEDLHEIEDFESVIDEVVDAVEEEVQFNLGSVVFTAGESGVRVSTGGTERFVAGPGGIVVRRSDGSPIFMANESGVRAGSASGRGNEQFRFKTGRGTVSIDVAEDQPARVELIVNRGDVQSDIRLVEVGRPGPRSSTRRYVGVSDSSETDRILIRARTDRGDIRIRTAYGQQEQPRTTDRNTRDRQRRQILEALSQGRISADEADILLAAMERESG